MVQAQPRELANIFYHLMGDIWESNHEGEELAGTRISRADDMLQRFYPEAWDKRITKESEHGNYFLVSFPDNSTLVVYEDGSGLEQV